MSQHRQARLIALRDGGRPLELTLLTGLVLVLLDRDHGLLHGSKDALERLTQLGELGSVHRLGKTRLKTSGGDWSVTKRPVQLLLRFCTLSFIDGGVGRGLAGAGSLCVRAVAAQQGPLVITHVLSLDVGADGFL